MELITTIQFKSTEDNYNKESSGMKNNTVRVFDTSNPKDMGEESKIDKKSIKYIRICCVGGIQSFVRELKDITWFSNHGLIIYIFSW